MGQQQSVSAAASSPPREFKVSFSVGTKLLFSVVTLLFVSITFLDISTILLLEKDKRAYTYQSQSTEALLVGREFTNRVRYSLDSLRIALAGLDPTQAVTPQQQGVLQTLTDNQSDILGISIEKVLPDGKTVPLARAHRGAALAGLELKPEDLEVAPELMKEGLPELRKDSVSLANSSKVGKSPVLAVILADLKYQDHPGGLPVAIGYLSLKGWGKEVSSSNLTIANREGWVLFDTDTAALYSKRNILDDALFEIASTSQLSSGAQEFTVNGERFLGSFHRPGFNLMVLGRTEWRRAMSATFALTEKFVLLGFMAIGAAIIFALLFSKTISAPINALYRATREVAAGKFDLNLDLPSRDEIGALTGSFNVMSSKIRQLIEESMRKVHLENELAIASTVQQTLIPPSSFSNDYIQIYSHYQSASECGGDWWGYFGVRKRLCLLIADATGHGLPSALITAAARSCFSVMHKLAQEDPDFSFSPAAMLSYANRVVHDAASGKIMMTFFAATVDFEAKTLTYSSAGHNPPWLFKNEGGAFKLKSLTSRGQRLGEARDVGEFEEHSVELSAGDMLFLYTDGLMEGKNPAGEMYGKKKTRRVVEENLSGGPEPVIKKLMADFMAHNGDKELDDDVTLAVVKLFPKGFITPETGMLTQPSPSAQPPEGDPAIS